MGSRSVFQVKENSLPYGSCMGCRCGNTLCALRFSAHSERTAFNPGFTISNSASSNACGGGFGFASADASMGG
jgi:hypothetical protein